MILLTVVIENLASLACLYELDIKNLSNGLIKYNTTSEEEVVFKDNKTRSDSKLNSFDCYSLGNTIFSFNEYFESSEEWLLEAINRSDNKTTIQLLADIYQTLALNEYELNNIIEAIKYMRRSLKLSPERKSNYITIEYFKSLLNKKVSF